MSIIDQTWVHEFFVGKGDLFLRWFTLLEERGRKQAEGIAKILHRYGARKVLDLCCGVGRIAIPLAELGFEVVGVDISSLYVQEARKKASERGVATRTKFMVGDVRKLSQHVSEYASFDAILSVWTSIGYFEEADDLEIFKQAREVTRKGGILIIADTACKESFLTREFREEDIMELEDLVAISKSSYDPLTSRLRTRWRYYRKRGKDLEFVAEVEYNVRIYGINEVAKMLEETGWEVLELYGDIVELQPYKLGRGLNLVAEAI